MSQISARLYFILIRSLKLTRCWLNLPIHHEIRWSSDSVITYSHPNLEKDLWGRVTPCQWITASRTTTGLALVRLSDSACLLWCVNGMWSLESRPLFGLSLALILLLFYLFYWVSLGPCASLERKLHPVPTSRFPFCSHVPWKGLCSKRSLVLLLLFLCFPGQ